MMIYPGVFFIFFKFLFFELLGGGWEVKETFDVHDIPIYSVKDSQKFEDTQARLLFNLGETSITCRMVENVCNIVVFDSSCLAFTNYCI